MCGKKKIVAVSKVANIGLQIEREIARLSICDLPPPPPFVAASLVSFAACHIYLWPIYAAPALQGSRRVCDIAKMD